MKNYLLAGILVSVLTTSHSQTDTSQKPPSPSEIDKMMAEAMKDMTPEEQAQMKTMMQGMMPAAGETSSPMAVYADFVTNTDLVPKKDAVRTAKIRKGNLVQADVPGYASMLYDKIMGNGGADELTLVKSLLQKAPKAEDLNHAAILCMEQGHDQAAMALSMKAVLTDPDNPNLQNNMASLLTQYGYPEQAIPVLQKVTREFPLNSTVLNNLGQAWFGLGELDSAKVYIARAIAINPSHSDAKVCGGIIEELQGDPQKATQEYIEAMETGPNPIIEKILKNKEGNKGLEKIDLAKFLKSITIYEYFPEDWIQIPQLSDNTSGFETDQGIQNGYAKMFEALNAKLQEAQEAAQQETEILANKGEEEFIQTMMQENAKGINTMSRTAATVMMVLESQILQWSNQNKRDQLDLKNTIEAQRETMTKSDENDDCAAVDRKNNEFLAYANPLIRQYYGKKIEEFRVWLNAFCTWSWYLTGNPKNIILMNDLGWTAQLTELYESAILEQESASMCGVTMNGDGSRAVAIPDIPNFSCPALVQVPIGKDWQQLGNTTKNFDTNGLGIKKNPGKTVPNHTLTFDTDRKSISQPRNAATVHSADGSIVSGNINSDDDLLVPIPNLPKEELLTPLPDIPRDEPVPLPDLRRSKLLKEVLNKMMSADCKNVKSPQDKLRESIERMMQGVKELDAYTEMKERLKEFEQKPDKLVEDQLQKEQLKSELDKMMRAVDELDKFQEMQEFKKKLADFEKASDALVEESIKKEALKEQYKKIEQLSDELVEAPSTLENIKQNGLQPTLNSGVQVPGSIQSTQGLFNN